MINKNNIERLKKLEIFKGFKEHQLIEVVQISQQIAFKSDDFIIHEGKKNDAFYILLEGEIELLQKNQDDQQYYLFATLKPHDYFGTLALIENTKNITSARAITTVKLLEIKTQPFHELTEKMQINRKIMQHISGKLYDHINSIDGFTLNEHKLEKKQRIKLNAFLIGIISVLCFYAFILKFSNTLLKAAPANTIITTAILFIYLISALIGARFLRYPLKFYGLTLQNWQRSVLESLAFTLPIFIFVLIIKWLLIHFSNSYQGLPLFNPFGVITNRNPFELNDFSFWLLMCAFYIIHAPIQEFLIRGLLQSLMQDFFIGKYRILNAILCSNIIFATFHLFIAMKFAFFIFLPGLFWGWLYSRQKTLIGPALSHILLGLWSVFIVGFSLPH